MGVRISKNLSMSTVRLDDYEQVPAQQGIGQIADYKVLKNRLTGNEMEEYSLQFGDLAEYQDYYDAYYWRLSQDHVVRTLHFIDTTRRQFCSTTYTARLYIERIPMKLSDIKDIPYPDNLYVLLSSLDGFDRIVQKTGYFEIEEYMICINKQGQVKVWLNDNLSRNYPDVVRNKRVNSEEQMVRKLIGIIEGNTDRASQPSSLSGYIYSQVTNPSFGDAMLLVREYARQNRIDIPANFECIMQVLNNSNYPTQHTHSEHTISHYSNIRSSVPVVHQVRRNNSLLPSFGPGLVTQIDPHIPSFSKVSNQIPSNSRFHALQKSARQNYHPSIQHRQVRRISKSPLPVPTPIVARAAPSIIPARQVFVSPHKIQNSRYQIKNVVRKTNFSPQKSYLAPHNIQSNKSLGKSVSFSSQSQHQNPQLMSFHNQNIQEIYIPTIPNPIDIRQVTQIQQRQGARIISTEEVGRGHNISSHSILQNNQSQVSRNSHHQVHNNSQQNIYIQNKQEIKQRPTRKQQSKQILNRTSSPHKDIASEFINPFFQQQDSPQFIPQPYPQLRIQTRQNQHLQIQTPDDKKNQKQLQQIKRNKIELIKQAKQMVSKMIKQSENDMISRQKEYNEMKQQQIHYNQSFGQTQHNYHNQSKGINSRNNIHYQFNQQASFGQPHYEESNKLLMSFEKRGERSQRTELLIYHSATDSHHIDPQIARDLLALGQ